ncbi:hypothetical protein G7Y31_06690 [Corynebacterium lizhenjunii]|uniref:Uncharacterized protein n=1 Tax=Corynebacterium lizhenjunii TaxID=2709394 RepID=A0A7T0PB81_9CORY|nr:hypothetical protein [Corynebacterium lizhenjunii]QPK78272.1 hypothetical protein G7Y31_06690 [Corynebacterium lizhenjunii]
MQLNVAMQQWGSEDQRWLGSAHGVDAAQTVTLNGEKLTAFAKDGVIPSGIALKKEGSRWEPVTDAGDTLAGFLLTSQSFKEGAGDVVAPMLDHGRIRVEHLPKGGFDVTKLTTPNPLFVLVGEKKED